MKLSFRAPDETPDIAGPLLFATENDTSSHVFCYASQEQPLLLMPSTLLRTRRLIETGLVSKTNQNWRCRGGGVAANRGQFR